MAEGIATNYLEQLETESNIPLLLSRMYNELFDIPIDSKLIITIARLIKIYGKYNAYWAILDLATFDKLDHGNIFPLLVYLAKKEMLKQQEPIVYMDTKNVLDRTERLSKKKLKIIDPFV
jgi:hypothetical protein